MKNSTSKGERKMNREKMLLENCVGYIYGIVGEETDFYDVLTNVIGFTEEEADKLEKIIVL